MPALGVTGLMIVGVITGWLAVDPDGVWQGHVTDQALRASTETAVFLMAVASSALLLGNFRRTRHLGDLLLVVALVCAALTALVFHGLPAYGYEPGLYGATARMAMTLLMAAVFLTAALAPADRPVTPGRRWGRRALWAALGWVALGAAVDVIAGPVFAPGSAGLPEAVVVIVALIAFCGFGAAACVVAIRPCRDAANAWLLGGAALFMGAAQLQKMSNAAIPSDWVTSADAFRICAYALLLALSLRLYRASQAQAARDAIHAERVRIARDLHDGLAQDLAFIASHSDRLALTYGGEHPLTIAAQRALAASRGTIVDLEASHAPTAAAALRAVSAELSSRFAVDVSVNADAFTGPTDTERGALVRIAREAIVNSVRHGGARKISVMLGSRSEGVLLRVTDDGCGFAAADKASGGTGLGLSMMADRATQIGAQLTAASRSCGGSEIEIVSDHH
jgi:signal transduction histidine kinase